jgi:hypothetical protein
MAQGMNYTSVLKWCVIYCTQQIPNSEGFQLHGSVDTDYTSTIYFVFKQFSHLTFYGHLYSYTGSMNYTTV